MNLPRYPEYKPSGVEWLGEVPAHWAASPLLSVARERSESNAGMVEDNLLSLSYGSIVQKDITANDGLLPESFETYQVIHPGDIVLRLTDLQNDKRSLRSALVGEKGIITSAYLCLAPSGISPAYLAHLMRAYDVSKVFYSMGGGLRQSMKFADLKRLPVAVPPLAEQTSIAAFLDRETAKIDVLVAEQQRLITLLKEKRQAVISHAVTKGLDPDVPMKPSGIEWLGDVPAHWEVGAIGYLSAINTGATPDRGVASFWDGEIPWLKTGEINWTPISEAEEFITDEAVAGTAVKLSPPGTMLMAMYGQGVTRGRVALLEIEATYNQACAAISFGPRISPQFAIYFFMAAYDHIRDSGNETSQMNLNAEVVGNFKMTIPPIEEQCKIAAYIDDCARALDALHAQAQCAIKLLQERRSALISAAVTGQIDVRGAA